MRPRLVVVAGSNGAGKSTLTRHLRDPSLPVIDPDRIAADSGLSPVAAGREALRLFEEHCQRKQSFLIETTMSGKALLRNLARAQGMGFRLTLRYVGLASPELARQRVRQRVLLGGHDIPHDDIERRYARSFANLPLVLRMADDARLYDNSGDTILPVVDVQAGQVQWLSHTLRPDWAVQALQAAGLAWRE